MDIVELRNLLLHPKIDANVSEPMGYHAKTFKMICDVVEKAMRLESSRSIGTRMKVEKQLITSVKKLKRLKAGPR